MSDNKIFEFHDFRLNPAKRSLDDPEGKPVKLLPKAFDILVLLVENRDRVLTKDDLFNAIWPDAVVEENNLTQNISSLRRAFGEKPYENRFISTVPGRGYRFVAAVDVEAVEADERPRDEFFSQVPSMDFPSPAKSSSSSRFLISVAAGIGLIAFMALGYFYYYRASTSPDLKTLAILPLKPITLENRDEALEMGITDSLISRLGGTGELRVLPLAAVRRFGALDQDPISSGGQLKVDAVLDGGMQISNGRVRISVKLLRVADGRQLWAGQFDEELKDIFTVQDSISQRVAAALARPLGSRPRSYTHNVEAYQLFMRGKYHAYKLILPEVQKGIDFYEQAIAADPGYALAYAELSNAYRAMVLTNGALPAEMFPRSKAAAAKAVELDDTLAEAWTALAFNEFWYDWDWQASEEHFKRALAIDPNSAQTHAYYAHLLSNIGRHDEAMSEIRRARELEPVLLLYAVMEGQILCFAGQTDRSTLVLKAVIDIDPNFWLAHLFLARNYIQKEMWSDALVSAGKAKELSNGNAEAIGTMGYILGRSGETGGARSITDDLEARSHGGYVSAYSVAFAYMGLGDKPATLNLLEKAVEQKDPLIVFLKVEPRWESLRTEPRFVELLRRLKFENQ